MNFIYLIQHQNKPVRLLNEILLNNNVDYKVLTFKEKVEDNNFIFAPNTTWTTGRNLLLSTIDTSKYDYVIFLDGDIELKSNYNENSFIEFQKCLNIYNPTIATPFYAWHTKSNNKIDKIMGFDPCFNAFKTDKIDLFLPYNPKYDNESWWYSGILIHDKVYTHAYGEVYQFNDFTAVNNEHTNYVKAGNFKKVVDQNFENKNISFKYQESGKIDICSIIIK